MLEKLDPSATRALIQIRGTPMWPVMDQMLLAELDKTYELMTATKDAVAMHQFQGRAQLIRELRKAVADATAP